MRTIVLACVAVATLATSATADTGSCLALSDPAGDAALVQSEDPLLHMPADDGLDLVAVAASATTDAVSVTFTVAGTPRPLPGGDFVYKFQFSSGQTRYSLEAHSAYGDLRWPNSNPFLLATEIDEVDANGTTVTHGETTGVPGSIDYVANTVTVTAPAAVFGGLTAGQELAVTDVYTNQGEMSFSLINVDHATAPHTLVVGAGC